MYFLYDIYFQKEELMENDFIRSFNSQVNRVEYNNITLDDAFWYEDQNLIDRKYQTEYNFVETKYLSLGLEYNMTEVLFENILLLKSIFIIRKLLMVLVFLYLKLSMVLQYLYLILLYF